MAGPNACGEACAQLGIKSFETVAEDPLGIMGGGDDPDGITVSL